MQGEVDEENELAALKALEAEVEAKRRELQEARLRVQNRQQLEVRNESATLQQRQAELDAIIEAEARDKAELMALTEDIKVAEARKKREQERLDEEIAALERQQGLDVVLARKVELERVLEQRNTIERLLWARTAQLDSIHEERERRETRNVNQLEHLLRSADVLRKELESGEYDERDKARIATAFFQRKGAGDDEKDEATFQLLDEMLTKRRRRLDAITSAKEERVRELNAERLCVDREQRAVRKRRKEHELLLSKGLELMTEIELGHGPPLRYVLLNADADLDDDDKKEEEDDDDDEDGLEDALSSSSSSSSSVSPLAEESDDDEAHQRQRHEHKLERLRRTVNSLETRVQHLKAQQHVNQVEQAAQEAARRGYDGRFSERSCSAGQVPLYREMRAFVLNTVVSGALRYIDELPPGEEDLLARQAELEHEKAELRRVREAQSMAKRSAKTAHRLLDEVVVAMTVDVFKELRGMHTYASELGVSIGVEGILDQAKVVAAEYMKLGRGVRQGLRARRNTLPAPSDANTIAEGLREMIKTRDERQRRQAALRYDALLPPSQQLVDAAVRRFQHDPFLIARASDWAQELQKRKRNSKHVNVLTSVVGDAALIAKMADGPSRPRDEEEKAREAEEREALRTSTFVDGAAEAKRQVRDMLDGVDLLHLDYPAAHSAFSRPLWLVEQDDDAIILSAPSQMQTPYPAHMSREGFRVMCAKFARLEKRFFARVAAEPDFRLPHMPEALRKPDAPRPSATGAERDATAKKWLADVGACSALAVSPNGAYVAVGTSKGDVLVYTLQFADDAKSPIFLHPRTLDDVQRVDGHVGVLLRHSRTPRKSAILEVRWAPSSHELTTRCAVGDFVLWSVRARGGGSMTQEDRTERFLRAPSPLTVIEEVQPVDWHVPSVTEAAPTREQLSKLLPTAMEVHPAHTMTGAHRSLVVALRNGTVLKWNASDPRRAINVVSPLRRVPPAAVNLPAAPATKRKIGERAWPTRELFRGHGSHRIIVYVGFLRLSSLSLPISRRRDGQKRRVNLEESLRVHMVTVDQDGYVFVWAYTADQCSGYGWFEPTLKTRLVLHRTVFTPAMSRQEAKRLGKRVGRNMALSRAASVEQLADAAASANHAEDGDDDDDDEEVKEQDDGGAESDDAEADDVENAAAGPHGDMIFFSADPRRDAAEQAREYTKAMPPLDILFPPRKVSRLKQGGLRVTFATRKAYQLEATASDEAPFTYQDFHRFTYTADGILRKHSKISVVKQTYQGRVEAVEMARSGSELMVLVRFMLPHREQKRDDDEEEEARPDIVELRRVCFDAKWAAWDEMWWPDTETDLAVHTRPHGLAALWHAPSARVLLDGLRQHRPSQADGVCVKLSSFAPTLYVSPAATLSLRCSPALDAPGSDYAFVFAHGVGDAWAVCHVVSMSTGAVVREIELGLPDAMQSKPLSFGLSPDGTLISVHARYVSSSSSSPGGGDEGVALMFRVEDSNGGELREAFNDIMCREVCFRLGPFERRRFPVEHRMRAASRAGVAEPAGERHAHTRLFIKGLVKRLIADVAAGGWQ